MSDMKEIASELGAINRVVKGISDDFQGFGISFKEAQTAIADQKSAIDKLDIKMAKNGQFIATRKQVFEMPEVKKMFDYIRNTKSMAVNDGPSGGYLVHTEYLNYVFEKVRDVDEIRANATVLTTGTSALGIPTEDQDAGLEWVGETEDRPETDAPTFGQVNIPVTEAHAKIRMTRIMRDDASFDVESYITRKLIDRITRGEGKAFVNGKGTTVPEGLWACSKIGSIESTATAGSISADDLLDMTAEVPWALESECAFIMNKRTEVAIRKLKDSDGQYLWNPSLIDGMPSTFGGYRIVKAPSAPDIASSAFPVMYGALKDYAIVDRQGVELIVDETSATLRSKGQIEYQFNCRLGAAVVQPASFVKLEVQ